MMKNHPVLESKKTPLYPKQAEHLRFQRKKLEKKQNEICEIIGRDLTTYRKWEKGYDRPDCEVLVQLSEMYGVSTDYLLGRIDEKDHDIKFIHDYTGLDGNAIEELHNYDSNEQHTLSGLIVSAYFRHFLLQIERLAWSVDALLRERDNANSVPSDDNMRNFFSLLQTARVNSFEAEKGGSRLLESITKAQSTIDDCMAFKRKFILGK